MFVADAHGQPRAAGGDGQVAVAETTDEVEGFAGGLLVGEAHRVVGDALFDGLTHLRSGAEEAVCRHETSERLVRPLEVVGMNEEPDTACAVCKIRKHRARQKLRPKRLPKAFDLADGLRMLWATLDVANAVAAELVLEFRFAAPSGVLPALIGEDFARRPEVRDAACERLHHERRPLVMRERMRHEKARVIV